MSAKGIGVLMRTAATAILGDFVAGAGSVTIMVVPVSSLGNRGTDGLTTGPDPLFFPGSALINVHTRSIPANSGLEKSNISILSNKSVEFDVTGNPIEIERADIPDNEVNFLEFYIDGDEQILEVWSEAMTAHTWLEDHLVGAKEYSPKLDIPENSVFRVKKVTVSNNVGVTLP